LTGEALALYVVGTALPELARSRRWTETGRRILVREIDRQIHRDGGHVEGSTHYHRYTLDIYLLALLTATRANDRVAAPWLTEAVTRLAEFARTIADDQGRVPLIGDDDGGMLWPLTGRRCDDLRDSLALAAMVLDRPDLAPWEVPEETFWLAGPLAASGAASLEARRRDALPKPSRTFPHSGHVVARDADGSRAVFDVGVHGFLNGGHAHADALSLILGIAGRPLLVDPGTSTYTMDRTLRDRMRASASHNTVEIDDRPQSIPRGPFHWLTRTDAVFEGSRHNPAFDWAQASHDGYAPLRHRRTLFHSVHAGWFVADEILGSGPHAARAYWHFHPDCIVTTEGSRVRVGFPDNSELGMLFSGGAVTEDAGATVAIGCYAPVYGTLEPAPLVVVTREAEAPFAMLTWIDAATVAARSSISRMSAVCEPGGTAVCVTARAHDRSSELLLRSDGATGVQGRRCETTGWHTDARVLHCVTRSDRIVALDVVDATHVLSAGELGLSIVADAAIDDLHVSADHGTLDLHAVRPPPRLSLVGGLVSEIDRIRLNGREWPLTDAYRAAVIIDGADWREHDAELALSMR
jgi:hypothetical protein